MIDKSRLASVFLWVRRRGPAALLLLLLAVALRCDSGSSLLNPSSLWINIAQREVDLVLVDYEPPPF